MAVNWDNLNIGRPELDHSQRFFEKRHLEHERANDLALKQLLLGQKPVAKVQGRKSLQTPENDKENAEKSVQEIVEETVSSLKNLAIKKKVLGTTNQQPAKSLVPKCAEFKKPGIAPKKPFEPAVKQFKARPLPKFIQKNPTQNATGSVLTKAVPDKNIPVKSAPPSRPITRAMAKTLPKPASKLIPPTRQPPVAKVAPQPKNPLERVSRKTAPVKRHSRGLRISTSAPAVPARIANARRTFDVEKSTQRSKSTALVPEVKKFVAKVPKYLYREPFKAKLEGKKEPVEVKPKVVQKTMSDRHKLIEEKNKKIQAEKLRKEQEELKNLRKQREFKAKPNPFSKAVKKSA